MAPDLPPRISPHFSLCPSPQSAQGGHGVHGQGRHLRNLPGACLLAGMILLFGFLSDSHSVRAKGNPSNVSLWALSRSRVRRCCPSSQSLTQDDSSRPFFRLTTPFHRRSSNRGFECPPPQPQQRRRAAAANPLRHPRGPIPTARTRFPPASRAAPSVDPRICVWRCPRRRSLETLLIRV